MDLIKGSPRWLSVKPVMVTPEKGKPQHPQGCQVLMGQPGSPGNGHSWEIAPLQHRWTHEVNLITHSSPFPKNEIQAQRGG